MTWTSFSPESLNLKVGSPISTDETATIADFIFDEIVKGQGGRKEHAQRIVALSHCLRFDNPLNSKSPIIKISWYSRYSNWKYFVLVEWFYFRKPTLERISPPIPRELFWLPEFDSRKDTASADLALRKAISLEPALGKLLAYRTDELSRFGVLLPEEEMKLFPEFYS